MKNLRVYGLTCVLLMVASIASATTIVMPTDEQLITKAPLIVEGTVVSSAPELRDEAVWTRTVVQVARALKGDASGSITVEELGGETEDRITKIFGSPEYVPGERVLLFLEKKGNGRYRTIDLFVGKFKQEKALNGRRLWMRDDFEQDATLLDADFKPMKAKNVQRDAEKFEQFVADRVRGRGGVRNYGIENPVVEGGVTARVVEEGITSNFTLISEPSVYRWTRFDSGQSAVWYSSGSQPGYTSGGVSELETAMDAWTSYSAAKIYYSYSGNRAGSMGGLSAANGVNEVLFNDPLSEIAGSYSRSTGGVVGQGGFNGVSGSTNWVAPFAADASHPAGTIRAWTITEGNLTIQDGVTPTNGISSGRLAEIISHEFGHTLGFGHSADGNALMYYSVTGLGPSLRADDQLAARWLYPNGSNPPPAVTVPTAPSSLTAQASGSNVDLFWKDNASNESGYRIYLAVNGGAYSKVADAAAGATSARLSSLGSGSYLVSVRAWNSAGESSSSNTASFTIAQAPVAAFSVSPGTGVAGVTSFSFYDESQGTVTSRTWSFGDGTTSTSAVASHVYAQAGQYTVTLTVSGNGVSSQASRIISVSAQASAPVASFSVNTLSGTTGVTQFVFTDQSSGSISTRSWNFGDGRTSSGVSVSHVYSSAGQYTVTLTVSGSGGTAQTSRTISVANAAPVTPAVNAAFDLNPSTPVAGNSVAFFDRSTGSPTRWAWSFGDGRTSSAQNPTHSYAAAGTYTVTLTASNSGGSSSTSRQVNVAGIEPFRTLVSAAAQSGGIGGTSWRTELTIFNAGSQGANVTLLYLPAGGGSVATRSIYLGARQSSTWNNTLYDLFAIGNGTGAVAIEATSGGGAADLRVTSRTFTSGGGGTYGQAVPDVAPSSLESTLYVTGIESNAAFRTNIGLVNRQSFNVPVTLTLLSSSGAAISTRSLTLPANSFQQSSLPSYFPEAGTVAGVMTMRLNATSADAVTAYASVVDNLTQDPTYVQAATGLPSSSATVPVVGRANGANGTFWRSDLTVHNPGSTRTTLTLRYRGASKAVAVDSGDTTVLRDLVSQLGQGDGSGPLSISWTGPAPVITSRTYTSVASGGTYGQSINAIESFAARQFVAGLRHDASYRTNAGFVNGGYESETFAVRAISQDGIQLGQTYLTLAPGEQVQQSAAVLFPNAWLGSFTLEVQGDANARLFAYGSMVDNATGDPVFFAGR